MRRAGQYGGPVSDGSGEGDVLAVVAADPARVAFGVQPGGGLLEGGRQFAQEQGEFDEDGVRARGPLVSVAVQREVFSVRSASMACSATSCNRVAWPSAGREWWPRGGPSGRVAWLVGALPGWPSALVVP
jgi:hypothetical protein